MTLITLHSRIHFARNVLEEALRAEVDARRLRRAILLGPEAAWDGDFAARVQDGMNSCLDVVPCAVARDAPKEATAEVAVQVDEDSQIDVIVAFGSAQVIAHARKCRHAIATARRIARPLQGEPARGAGVQPELFVLPGIDGLPDPCMDSNPTASIKTTPPNVIICDPTVLEDASEVDRARALALTLGRCISVLGADTFNPLADGLAMDALVRLVSETGSKHPADPMETDTRELMAATLNGAIALQKGTGLVEALAYSLGKSAGRQVDSAALHRVLLARMADGRGRIGDRRVSRVLGLSRDHSLSQFVDTFVGPMPLPDSLRGLSITWDEVETATGYMERKFGTPQMGSPAELRQVLRDAYHSPSETA